MYLKAVIDEANDRDHQTIQSSMDAYLTMRRDTGAVKCCFDLLIAAEILHDILKF
jgi:Holliday junction resolvase-like predicted endonuclease